MEKIGFAIVLVGLGGAAEAYPNVNHITISLALIGIGAVLMYLGVSRNEKKNIDNRGNSSNVLDRLRFLP